MRGKMLFKTQGIDMILVIVRHRFLVAVSQLLKEPQGCRVVSADIQSQAYAVPFQRELLAPFDLKLDLPVYRERREKRQGSTNVPRTSPCGTGLWHSPVHCLPARPAAWRPWLWLANDESCDARCGPSQSNSFRYRPVRSGLGVSRCESMRVPEINQAGAHSTSQKLSERVPGAMSLHSAQKGYDEVERSESAWQSIWVGPTQGTHLRSSTGKRHHQPATAVGEKC